MSRRIFLTGFMGSGKTTVGRLLAHRLRQPFVDLDRRVETIAGLRVAEIFERGGEAGFRRLERQALEETVAAPAAVVATGGGVLSESANRRLIRDSGLCVWLDAPFATLAARVAADGPAERPLFLDAAEAEALYRRRRPLYRRQADLRVAVGADETPAAVAARILERLEESACAT